MWGANRALPVADEAGKSPQRRQWRMQQGDFEEVPRLAATIVAGNRLAQRWAGASGRGQNFKRPPLGSVEILGTATGPPPPTECLPIAVRRGRRPRRPELGLYRIPCNVSLRGRAAPVAIRTPVPYGMSTDSRAFGPASPTAQTGLIPHSMQCVIARARRARGNPYPKPPLPKGRGTSHRLVEGFVRGGRQFIQLSFIPNRIDCSFSFQRLSVWMTSSSVSVFGRICKMENWKNLYRSGCAQITSFISLLCPCSEST